MDYFAKTKFDARKEEPSASLKPIPKGRYTVVLKDMKTEFDDKGKGTWVVASMQVIEGDYTGGVARDWFIMDAENIDSAIEGHISSSKKKLADLLRAIGVPAPRNTKEILKNFTPFVIKVEKHDDPDIRNRVTDYIKISQKGKR